MKTKEGLYWYGLGEERKLVFEADDWRTEFTYAINQQNEQKASLCSRAYKVDNCNLRLHFCKKKVTLDLPQPKR